MEQNKVTGSNEAKEENQEKVAEKSALPTTEHLAMEILKQESDKHKARNRGLFAGMVILGIVTIAVAAFGWIERSHLVDVNYQNDCEWRTLFSDYDFISQDGEGINSINDGMQGDLINGSESEEEEGQDDR